MDENGLTYDSRRFEPVWDRVLGKGGPNEKEDSLYACLMRFMDDEATDERAFRSIASRTGGRYRGELLRMASDEKRWFRRLRTAYFILTGDTYAPEIGQLPRGGTASALRYMYERERAEAESYEAAAKAFSRRDVRELFEQLAEEEKRHASEAAAMLENIMDGPPQRR